MSSKKNDSPGGKSDSTESTSATTQSKCRPEILLQLSVNVKKAYNAYHKAAAAAEKEEGNTPYDGPVFVEIPSSLNETDGWFTADEIGTVSRNVGPGLQHVRHVRVDAYAKTREIEIHGLASGHRHSRARVEVNDAIAEVTRTYRRDTPEYIQHSSVGTYGVNYITAPDVLLGAVGSPAGNGLRDSPEAPIFVCEIEDHHRSLPALIRHVGALFTNYPNLNAVVGIKGGRTATSGAAGDRLWAALFMVEQQAPIGLSVTALLDFGQDRLTDAQKTNAENTLVLPVPPAGTKPVSGTHGLGLQGPIMDWDRLPAGLDAMGNSVNHEIPLSLLLSGARAANGVALNVPAGAGAMLRLPVLLRRYFDD